METALYIHFPFCVRKCLYCDFNSLAGSEIPHAEYTDSLIREMELRRNLLPAGVKASTLYLGGGTPSLLEPHLVGRIIESAIRFYRLAPDAEITIEANPGTINRVILAAFRSAGVNRLSLGIQSFLEEMLNRLGRVHTAREGLESFAAARDAGFDNIGIDLINSQPGQTIEMWQSDLDQSILLRPEHISSYGLTIEAGTPFHAMERKGELSLPEEDVSAQMFDDTSKRLIDAGYEHYEISNFALDGFRSKHNQVYWQRGNYLGFGAGAHSYLSYPPFGRRWKNPDLPEDYMQAVDKGDAPGDDLSILTEKEAMSERLFLGLRMLEGVEVKKFHQEFGIALDEVYNEELLSLESKGLLEWQRGVIRLTARGLILANQVFMQFV
jgi:oxygen-independent coproporphyrinogen III oxidase